MNSRYFEAVLRAFESVLEDADLDVSDRLDLLVDVLAHLGSAEITIESRTTSTSSRNAAVLSKA
jgi:hypothetical protein